jgi:anti-anti-sigma factor
MEIRFAEQDGRLTIAFCGDLDNAAAPEAEKMLSRVYMQDEYDILLDCSRLNYISSKGLRLLINLYKHLRDTGHRGFITKMNKNVREVLHIGGFLTLYQEVE